MQAVLYRMDEGPSVGDTAIHLFTVKVGTQTNTHSQIYAHPRHTQRYKHKTHTKIRNAHLSHTSHTSGYVRDTSSGE